MLDLRCFSSARVPTDFGEFTAYTYSCSGLEHIALVMGKPSASVDLMPPLVRLHSECITGDVFGSLRCDCGEQLSTGLQKISEAEEGALIYLRGHEGRGIGLGHKLKAYELQDAGHDTVEANLIQGFEADSRSYEVAAGILKDLGLTRIRLMTNNPDKLSLTDYGIEIVERVGLEISPNEENLAYLKTKRDRLGHLLSDLG